MRIITNKNLKRINELNFKMSNAGINKKIKVAGLDTDKEVGVMIELPAIYNDSVKPHTVAISQNKDKDMFINEMVDGINEDVNDLLNTIEPEYLKLIRIKEHIVDEKKSNEDYFFIHINLKNLGNNL